MRNRSGILLTASALLLWQLAAAVLVPVVVLASADSISREGATGAAACPVCQHQAVPGAACPMHAEAASRQGGDGACAITSGDAAITMFTLLGSVGMLAAPLDMGVPQSVARMLAAPSDRPLEFSPTPSFPPPRA